MKKQIHILEGLLIILIIIIALFFLIEFIYNIRHEQVDTSYMLDINFSNLKVTEGSKEGNISMKDNIITLDLTFTKEEEFYEFQVDTVNLGTLDAKIKEIKLDIENDKNILVYNLSYLDKSNISIGDILPRQDSKTILFHIAYPKQKDKIYDSLHLKLTLYIEYTAIY